MTQPLNYFKGKNAPAQSLAGKLSGLGTNECFILSYSHLVCRSDVFS